MSKPHRTHNRPFAQVAPPTTGAFNGRLMNLSFEYLTTTLRPYQMDYFFRWLIARLEDDSLEHAESFIDFVHEKLVESQPNLKITLLSVVRKYKAVQRVQREEIANGVATVDSRKTMVDASKAAEKVLENSPT